MFAILHVDLQQRRNRMTNPLRSGKCGCSFIGADMHLAPIVSRCTKRIEPREMGAQFSWNFPALYQNTMERRFEGRVLRERLSVFREVGGYRIEGGLVRS